MNVYLAARYSRREELCGYRAQLEALDFTVTSRWLNGDHQVTDGQLLGEQGAALVEGNSQHESAVQLRQRFALEDWSDLAAADVCVAFTEPPRSGPSRGGRHVELGAALAWGKHVVVVGHRENVFCCLPGVHFCADWPAALLHLSGRRPNAYINGVLAGGAVS